MFPFRFTRAPAYSVGVDIGFDAVRMLQLAPAPNGGGGLAVVAAVERPLSTKGGARMETRVAAAADALRQALRGRHVRGRRVVAALPRELVHVRPMRLPPMPDSELPWAVLADARDLFPFDTAKARLQFLDAGEVRQAGMVGRSGGEVRREVLVVAAGEALVDEFVEPLHRAGAVVDSLDVEPCAVYRAAWRACAADEVCATIEVGAGRSQVVVGRGAQLRVIKMIEVGGRHFHEAVARKLNVSDDEAAHLRRRLAESAPAASGESPRPRDPVRRAVSDATRALAESLAAEAALALRYHAVAFRGPGPQRIRLAGAEAADPQLRAALAAALPCPVEPAGLFCGITVPPELAPLLGTGAAWAVALGLALRRVPAPAADAARTTALRTGDDVALGAPELAGESQPSGASRPAHFRSRAAAAPEATRV